MAVVESTAADHDNPAPHERPVRTCLGCRNKAADTALLRVVALAASGDDEIVPVVPDPRRRMPGRGAWLHPAPACVELAVRRRAFGRALRVSGTVDPAAVTEYVGGTRATAAAADRQVDRQARRTTPVHPRNEPAGDDEQ